MASDTRGVWTIRTEKVEQMFRELDGLMLGCVLPPAGGLAAGVLARRILALASAKPCGTERKQPEEQAHERGGGPPE